MGIKKVRICLHVSLLQFDLTLSLSLKKNKLINTPFHQLNTLYFFFTKMWWLVDIITKMYIWMLRLLCKMLYSIYMYILIELVYTPWLWHISWWQMNIQDPRQVWSSYASPRHASLFPRAALELLSLCWFHPAPRDQLEIPLWIE